MGDATNPRVGAIGLVLTLTCTDETGAAVDLTTASTTQIIIRPPHGPAVTKTATVVGAATLGVLRYTTIADDLGVVGAYAAQAYVAFSGGTSFYSSRYEFSVAANL